MHLSSRVFVPALIAGLSLGATGAAHAAKLTLGSDLQKSPTVAMREAQGADTAFWHAALEGNSVEAPEDGQVIEIRVKGAAMSESTAKNPPNDYVTFQTLGPAGSNGTRTGYLASAAFHMPVDTPEAITSFKPENLCIQKGGVVAFNTMGGFGWGGGDPFDDVPDPYVQGQYQNGTPWQIFAQAPTTTSLAWFSKDAGTKNGLPHTPSGGTNAKEGYGRTTPAKELLLQYVLATGNDRSQSCGGPRRHADGSLVDTTPDPNYLKVAASGGKAQQPYVTKDRKFRVGVYCGGQTADSCNGTATMLLGKKPIARATFAMPVMKTGFISLRLPKSAFRKLDRSRTRTLKTTLVLTSDVGNFTFPLTLKR